MLLIIEDDGVGFDPAAPRTAGHGFGLLGMQERAGLVGAMLEIESSRRQGHDRARADGDADARRPTSRPCLNATAPLRILLADDHVTVRHGLKLLIDSQPDMKVISEASDGNAAMQNAIALKPDVIVMDISMPGHERAGRHARTEAAAAQRGHRHADPARRRCLRSGAAARRRVGLRAEAERADRAAAGDSRRGRRRAVSRLRAHRARHRAAAAAGRQGAASRRRRSASARRRCCA